MSDQAQKMGGDFLERAVSRARGEYAVLAPRLSSLYEALDGPLVENGIVDHGIVDHRIVEAATDADSDPLRSGDALLSATETDPQRAPDNPPISRLTAAVRPVGRADDLIAPAPPKSLDDGADVRTRSVSQVQTYPELRLGARGGDLKALAPELAVSAKLQQPVAPMDGADVRTRSVPQVQTYPELRLGARGGDPKALAPGLDAWAKAQQAVAPTHWIPTHWTADFSQPEPALDHAPPQVYVPHGDETAARLDATHTPRTPEKSAQLVAQILKMQALPEPFERETPPAEPVIHVSIGRVEIRATQATNSPRALRNAPKLMGLDEYLNKRGARE